MNTMDDPETTSLLSFRSIKPSPDALSSTYLCFRRDAFSNSYSMTWGSFCRIGEEDTSVDVEAAARGSQCE